jgi:hypothetical protein
LIVDQVLTGDPFKKEGEMNIQQKINEENLKGERRKELRKEVEAFCERFDLAVKGRDDSIFYIWGLLDDHLSLVDAIACDDWAKVDIRSAVLMYLEQFGSEMDEIASELMRLSKQVSDERAAIIAEK